MGDKFRQAWIEEQSYGDWPFSRWALPELLLDQDAVKRVERHAGYLAPVVSRLFEVLGFTTRDLFFEKVTSLLAEAEEIVDAAVESSEAEAYATWARHSLWIPKLNESLIGDEHPAQLFVQALELVGPLYDTSASHLCAALGLWCISKSLLAKSHDNKDLSEKLLTESIVAATTADYYYGVDAGIEESRLRLSQRNQNAANARHVHNKANKERGLAIWHSRKWKPQSAAEREISTACNITQAVAARWIREFKYVS